jgi:hypothetical protein
VRHYQDLRPGTPQAAPPGAFQDVSLDNGAPQLDLNFDNPVPKTGGTGSVQLLPVILLRQPSCTAEEDGLTFPFFFFPTFVKVEEEERIAKEEEDRKAAEASAAKDLSWAEDNGGGQPS